MTQATPASREVLEVTLRLSIRSDTGCTARAEYDGRTVVAFEDTPEDALANAARKLGAMVRLRCSIPAS